MTCRLSRICRYWADSYESVNRNCDFAKPSELQSRTSKILSKSWTLEKTQPSLAFCMELNKTNRTWTNVFTDSLRPIYTSQRIEKTLPEPTCVQPSPNELSETISECDCITLARNMRKCCQVPSMWFVCIVVDGSTKDLDLLSACEAGRANMVIASLHRPGISKRHQPTRHSANTCFIPGLPHSSIVLLPYPQVYFRIQRLRLR